MHKVIKTTDTGKGMVRLYGNGIMHQTYVDGAELTIEDSTLELEIYRKEYCTEVKRPILVDINNIKTVSKESRGIYSSEETAECISAAALLIGNPVSRIMGNFYLGINKTLMPVKMFTSSEDAISWLITFIQE